MTLTFEVWADTGDGMRFRRWTFSRVRAWNSVRHYVTRGFRATVREHGDSIPE